MLGRQLVSAAFGGHDPQLAPGIDGDHFMAAAVIDQGRVLAQRAPQRLTACIVTEARRAAVAARAEDLPAGLRVVVEQDAGDARSGQRERNARTGRPGTDDNDAHAASSGSGGVRSSTAMPARTVRRQVR